MRSTASEFCLCRKLFHRIHNAALFIAISCAASLLPATRSNAEVTPADITIRPAEEPVTLFSGGTNTIPLVVESRAQQQTVLDLRLRLLQASSSTAVSLSETPWRKLTILPGQKLLEDAPVTLPAVKGRTRFIIKWFDHTNFLGSTEVLAFPTNLVAELKPLSAGEGELGLFDPGNVLKTVFAAQGVQFVDLGQTGVADFKGKLAIIGPFERPEQSPRDMSSRIKKLAGAGAAVLWIQPPNASERASSVLRPSFQRIDVGRGSIVLVQPELLRAFESSPQAQDTLVSLCKTALKQEQSTLPSDLSDEQ